MFLKSHLTDGLIAHALRGPSAKIRDCHPADNTLDDGIKQLCEAMVNGDPKKTGDE